jgi:hypothetical protein
MPLQGDGCCRSRHRNGDVRGRLPGTSGDVYLGHFVWRHAANKVFQGVLNDYRLFDSNVPFARCTFRAECSVASHRWRNARCQWGLLNIPRGMRGSPVPARSLRVQAAERSPWNVAWVASCWRNAHSPSALLNIRRGMRCRVARADARSAGACFSRFPAECSVSRIVRYNARRRSPLLNIPRGMWPGSYFHEGGRKSLRPPWDTGRVALNKVSQVNVPV